MNAIENYIPIEKMDLNFENAFWLRVMNDHLKILDERLAESETELHDRVHQLSVRAAQVMTNSNRQEALAFLLELIALKQELLRREDHGQVKLAVHPTTISDMLNEAFEYLGLLDPQQIDPRRHPTRSVLDLHKLWLTDIVGHLDLIKSELDAGTEGNLIKLVKRMKKNFAKLHHEALTLIEHSMNGGQPVAAIEQLTERAVQETVAYLAILRQLFQLRSASRVLGIVPPELLDHFYREQSYYLFKLGAGQQYRQQALNGLISPQTAMVQRVQDLQRPRSPPSSADLTPPMFRRPPTYPSSADLTPSMLYGPRYGQMEYGPNDDFRTARPQ